MANCCRRYIICGLAGLVVLGGTKLRAQNNFIYANNGSSGAPYIYKINTNNGVIAATYTNLSGINGRGVAVVGTLMYYTTSTSSQVYKYDLSQNKDLGVAFNISGSSGGLGSIAFDGTHLLIQDYDINNFIANQLVFVCTPVGVCSGTISFQNPCLGSIGTCDGLEFFIDNSSGTPTPILVRNRGDNLTPYDKYNATGGQVVVPFEIHRG